VTIDFGTRPKARTETGLVVSIPCGEPTVYSDTIKESKMMLIPVLLLALVGAGLFLYFQNRGELPWSKPDEEDPLEIARRRYARGEISSEQFDEIKRNLERKW
jgi:hypothetical protein